MEVYIPSFRYEESDLERGYTGIPGHMDLCKSTSTSKIL